MLHASHYDRLFEHTHSCSASMWKAIVFVSYPYPSFSDKRWSNITSFVDKISLSTKRVVISSQHSVVSFMLLVSFANQQLRRLSMRLILCGRKGMTLYLFAVNWTNFTPYVEIWGTGTFCSRADVRTYHSNKWVLINQQNLQATDVIWCEDPFPWLLWCSLVCFCSQPFFP